MLGDISIAQRKTRTAIRYYRDALETALDIDSAPEILRALIGFAFLLADEGEGEKIIQLLRFAMGHPAIKSSDQAKAGKLLRDLASEYSNDLIVADPETTEGIDLSEAAKMILSIIPGG